MPIVFLRFWLLVALMLLGAPAFGSQAPPSAAPASLEAQLAAASNQKQHRQEARKARRAQRLGQWLRKSCGCALPDPDEEAYDSKTQLIVLGIFLMSLGLAALTALYIIAPAALIGFKILALITAVVGDALICSYGSVCIFRTLYGIVGWIWL